MKTMKMLSLTALMMATTGAYSADKTIDVSKVECAGQRISKLTKLEMLVCLKKASDSGMFKRVNPKVMYRVRELFDISQSDTDLDLNNARYLALYTELENMGLYEGLNFIGEIQNIDNEDAQKNSLGNLANTTITSTQHRRLSELIAERRNIDELPKRLGKELGRIAKNKARFNGNPQKLHIHVRTRDLGDAKKDFSTFIKDLSSAGVVIWLYPNSVIPAMSMQEMSEIANYAARGVKRGFNTRFARPIKYSQVKVVSNWQEIIKVPLRNPTNINNKYDSIKDSSFRIFKNRTKVLPSARKATVNIDSIIRDYNIYQRFGNLIENGAYLSIRFPANLESAFGDKEFSQLYNLYSAIGTLGKNPRFNFFNTKRSQTTLAFNSKTSVVEKLKAINPRYKKPHISQNYYTRYLDCHIQLKDKFLPSSTYCKNLKQDGRILNY